MSTEKWTHATTIKLLKIAEKLPALWQENNPLYKNVEKKSQSFTVLANMMNLRQHGFDEIAANKKFRNIKDAILKRLKDIQHYDEAAQAAELQKTYLPHAAYLIEMFRDKHCDTLVSIKLIAPAPFYDQLIFV
jgi:dephospho-CoA kinase